MAKNVKLDEKGYPKYGMKDNLAYAAGDLGCNMSFALKGTLIIFWTQFMKMPSLWYSALLLIVLWLMRISVNISVISFYNISL